MTSAGGRVISLPECELVAVLSRDGAVRDRLWAAVRGRMPYRLDRRNCRVASAAPIPIWPNSPIYIAIGRAAGGRLGDGSPSAREWSRARNADSIVTVHIDRTGRLAHVMRSWTGSVPLYLAATPAGLFFSTRLAPLLASGVALADIATAEPGGVYEASESWTRRRQSHLTALRVPRQRSQLVRRVRMLVRRAVARIGGDGGVLLLSGGVDSTILAYLLKERVRHLEAVVMSVRGHAGSNGRIANDLAMARRAARWLGLKLHQVLLTPEQVARVAPEVVRIAETRRASIVDELSGMYHVARRLRALGVSTVYSGEGPDDVFGGLEFELRFTPMRRLHQRMRQNFLRELPLELAAQQKVFTHVGGIRVIHPLLFRPLVRVGLGTPPRLLIDRQRHMKTLFREAFAGDVPSDLLWRPKAITRVATGLKAALERRYGGRPTRYYALFSAWQASFRP